MRQLAAVSLILTVGTGQEAAMASGSIKRLIKQEEAGLQRPGMQARGLGSLDVCLQPQD